MKSKTIQSNKKDYTMKNKINDINDKNDKYASIFKKKRVKIPTLLSPTNLFVRQLFVFFLFDRM